jgi:hypothetical protein
MNQVVWLSLAIGLWMVSSTIAFCLFLKDARQGADVLHWDLLFILLLSLLPWVGLIAALILTNAWGRPRGVRTQKENR